MVRMKDQHQQRAPVFYKKNFCRKYGSHESYIQAKINSTIYLINIIFSENIISFRIPNNGNLHTSYSFILKVLKRFYIRIVLHYKYTIFYLNKLQILIE